MTKKLLGTIANLLIIGMLVCPDYASAQPDVSLAKVRDFSTVTADTHSCPNQLAWANDGDILASDTCTSVFLKCKKTGDCEVIPLDGLLGFARGITMDAQGNIYYTRSFGNKVTRCTPDHHCEDLFGKGGTEPGEFDGTRDIAIDSQGRLVIADRFNGRFQICDLQGNCTAHGHPLVQLPVEPGVLVEPVSLFTDRDGEILVGDTGPEYVHVCDETGSCSAAFGGNGNAVGQIKTPKGLGVTSRGDIVVVEMGNARISVCNRAGKCKAFGAPDFTFRAPSGLLIDGNDRLFVSDQDGQDIQVFDLTYLSEPPPPPEPDTILINPGLNDAWLNEATAGQGFFIIVFPDTGIVFLAWFTYDTVLPPEDVVALLGAAEHRWLTAQGPFDGDTATLDVFLTEGGVFDMSEPAPVTGDAIGTITIQWTDCENGVLTYDIDPPGVSGEIPITRIVPDNVALCEALAEN